jgi:hypothetical protein
LPLKPADVRLRARVRIRRRRLDRELAFGCELVSADHSLRARQLMDLGTRRQLASSLRKVVTEADRPQRVMMSSVPVRRAAVTPWREGLLGLAEALAAPEPLNLCGVARTLVLLSDGTGPLFNPTPKHSIAEMVWWIADGLQP